jgi:hypothetical protein
MSTIQQAIDRYEAGADICARAVAGLSAAELNAPPATYGATGWTVQQIIVHLWESDLAATHRMRRIIAEDKPLIIAYDETLCAQRLGYEHDDLALVARMFADNRRHTGALLRRQPAEAFARVGIHNQRGKVSLGDLVELYVQHVRGHMQHLLRKRQLLGKPLALDVP